MLRVHKREETGSQAVGLRGSSADEPSWAGLVLADTTENDADTAVDPARKGSAAGTDSADRDIDIVAAECGIDTWSELGTATTEW